MCEILFEITPFVWNIWTRYNTICKSLCLQIIFLNKIFIQFKYVLQFYKKLQQASQSISSNISLIWINFFTTAIQSSQSSNKIFSLRRKANAWCRPDREMGKNLDFFLTWKNRVNFGNFI